LAGGTRRKVTEHASVKTPAVWSPDSKRLAYTAANALFVYDLESNQNTQLAANPAGGHTVREFSRDGKWLVFTRSDEDQNSEVFLFDIAARQEHNVTRSPFRDSGGLLTPDGKRLVFISNRDGGNNHLFAVPLERQTENPNDPLVRERLKKEKEKKADDAFAVRIDARGIYRRARALQQRQRVPLPRVPESMVDGPDGSTKPLHPREDGPVLAQPLRNRVRHGPGLALPVSAERTVAAGGAGKHPGARQEGQRRSGGARPCTEKPEGAQRSGHARIRRGRGLVRNAGRARHRWSAVH
jgi:dipeptidyl aminopeptidase/acylaminoacyl peptidase